MGSDGELTDPWVIVAADEATTTTERRRERGAWYTPRAVAEEITARTFDAAPGVVPRVVLDPTCGAGAFLLAVLDRFVAIGVEPVEALRRVHGIDVDPGAVSSARRALTAWGVAAGVGDAAEIVARHLAVADAFDGLPPGWPAPDLVIGNPPFGSPLRDSAAGAAARSARSVAPDVLGPYADRAAAHLVDAARRLAPDGRIAMILPVSLASGRDGAGLRAWCDERFSTVGLWWPEGGVFDAGVEVMAPVLVAPRRDVSTPTWSDLAADAIGVPPVDVAPEAGELGGIAEVVAGFRDEFYAVAAVCREDEAAGDDPGDAAGTLRVTTVGSIDPLVCSWGATPIRFAKQRWERPVVRPDDLEGRSADWVARQRGPKVLLATQSRILEPFVDRTGQHLPVTPVLSLRCTPERIDHVAALLLAPPVVALARRRSLGSALSSEAIKLSADQVRRLPLPADATAWDRAARLVPGGAGRIDEIAVVMNEAFGGSTEVLDWWRERRATGRRTTRAGGTR